MYKSHTRSPSCLELRVIIVLIFKNAIENRLNKITIHLDRWNFNSLKKKKHIYMNKN